MPVVELDGAADRRRPPRPGGGTAAGAPAATLLPVTEKIRLGGMALANGVLVHGPTAWACAVRTADGELKVVARRKRLRAARGAKPDPARPCTDRRGASGCCRRSSGRSPRRSCRCRAGVCSPRCSAAPSSCRAIRRTTLRPVVRELLAGRALARARRPRAARRRARGVPRRGAHLDRDLRARRGAAEGARALRLAPRRSDAADDGGRQPRSSSRCPRGYRPAAKVAATVGALAASTEIFGWMTRHPRHPLARALAMPGHELQHRLGTREPSADQLEVAEAALRACLALEEGRARRDHDTQAARPVDLRPAGREDARRLVHRRLLQPHARRRCCEDGRRPQVVMQVFQKKDAYLGGMDEAIAILKLCADDWDALTVHALYDGDLITPYETVLTIEGDYTTFAHLETVYLGTLARRTLITTNVVHVLEAANGKPIIFMPARHDHHRVQTGDGYAAYVAGQVVGAPIGVTTDEQASWWGGSGLGTVPHALIAAYGGDTVAAAKHFADWAPDDMNVTVLVDFENDSVRTALDVARALGPRLWGVRLDTSEVARRPLALGGARRLPADRRQSATRPQGARRARRVRASTRCKIVVSGGFTRRQDPRVRGERRARRRVRRRLVADPRLERLHRRHRASPTGVPSAKFGRGMRPNPRLERVAMTSGSSSGTSTRRSTSCTPTASWRSRPRPRRCRRWQRLVAAARAAGIPHVASADDHELTDAEISESARLRDDVSAALPARHARRRQDRRDAPGRSGAARAHRRAGALAAGPRVPAAEEELRRLHQPERRPCCSTASTREEIVLFGVATDVCNDAAIRGLLARGRARHVRRGGLSRPRRGPHRRCLAAWRDGGVRFASVDEVLAEL